PLHERPRAVSAELECRREPLDLRLSDGVEPPLAGNALELAGAAVLELDPGPGNQVLDRLRHEHLSRSGLRGNPCTCVHGDPADSFTGELDLARVEAGADLEAEPTHGLRDRLRRADRARRTVERCEEAVTGDVDLSASKALEISADDL